MPTTISKWIKRATDIYTMLDLNQEVDKSQRRRKTQCTKPQMKIQQAIQNTPGKPDMEDTEDVSTTADVNKMTAKEHARH